jgi:hypothetical protein
MGAPYYSPYTSWAMFTSQNELDEPGVVTIQIKVILVPLEFELALSFKAPEKAPRLKTRATTNRSPAFKM